MATANELIILFVGLEISSISSYILAGFLRDDRRANESALKYFLLGSFATAFLLYGVAWIYDRVLAEGADRARVVARATYNVCAEPSASPEQSARKRTGYCMPSAPESAVIGALCWASKRASPCTTASENSPKPPDMRVQRWRTTL